MKSGRVNVTTVIAPPEANVATYLDEKYFSKETNYACK